MAWGYDPDGVKNWSKKIINHLSGDYDSFKSVASKFKGPLSNLVSAKVWAGDAAAKNYEDFTNTYNSFVKFLNNFSSVFSENMNSFNSSLNAMEIANLGSDTNILSELGVQSIPVSEIEKDIIKTSIAVYDHAKMTEISEAMKNISDEITSIREATLQDVNLIGEDSNIWYGEAAASLNTQLTEILGKPIDDIKAGLDKCIQNIKIAAENAAGADSIG